ncbi:50S ribosomal protein L6 [Anaerovorax odorimutans]|uniref:Large ribosomal subunit protein uL6 n=1 Tax=Anaerovorax odorimutans TaxID=109327 RepID=A0ABT1RJQ0_9FIRM|nr:50S ribosomal protein L6 [Anaerovorax odorimutans]MCQ4635413.1 50S ribosomal protein L6 [Anaerovorax odorimutans]
MSRIGIKPVDLPAGVEVKVDGNNAVTVKGPKGELTEQISKLLKVEIKDNTVTVSRESDAKAYREQHGLARSLIQNMVTGVTEGYEKKLELVGVGYKAEKKGKKLVLSLGYSHPVELEDPEGITTEAPSNTEITVKGIDKAAVGNYAANIRAWRKPEPYKGKGIRYVGEHIRRKEGKTGAK